MLQAYERPFEDIEFDITEEGSIFSFARTRTRLETTTASDAKKLLWGFGDATLLADATITVDEFSVPTVEAADYCPDFPEPAIYYLSSGVGMARIQGRGIGVNIRGWKYGLSSGSPRTARYHLARNHHGFIRDILEQPPETKWYDQRTDSVVSAPVQKSFVDQLGRPTDPLKTWASNLNTECSSSVPYDDGTARNRPAIDVTNLNIYSLITNV